MNVDEGRPRAIAGANQETQLLISVRVASASAGPVADCLTGEAECHKRRQQIATEVELSPRVAPVEALPRLTVGKTGEEALLRCDERVWHRGQRLGQAAAERVPGFAASPAKDVRLRVASSMRGVWACARRDVPEVRSSGATATDHA